MMVELMTDLFQGHLLVEKHQQSQWPYSSSGTNIEDILSIVWNWCKVQLSPSKMVKTWLLISIPAAAFLLLGPQCAPAWQA